MRSAGRHRPCELVVLISTWNIHDHDGHDTIPIMHALALLERCL